MSTPATTGTPARTPAGAATAPGAGRHPGTLTVLRWELAKLAGQARTRYTLLGCLIAPVLVVLVVQAQQQPPKDTIYGRHVHTSGFAMPLLMLAFCAQWVFPLLTAIVAGDIFANEDQHGTWKTVLTRSVSRTQIFWAKTLAATAFSITALVLLAASTITASLLIVGTQPLTGLNGQLIAAGTALKLVTVSWATIVAPLLGFTALSILLSVKTRNPAAGVAAPVVASLLMQLIGSNVGGIDLARRFLLTTPMEAWPGLLTQHRFYAPLATGLAVSAGWTAVCLTLAYFSLRRRDIAGG